MLFRSRESKLNFWPAYVDIMAALGIIGIVLAGAAELEWKGKISVIEKHREARKVADDVIENIKKELGKLNIKVLDRPEGICLPESVMRFELGKVTPITESSQENKFQEICYAIKKALDLIPDVKDNLKIVVEGHTDSLEIGFELKKYYPTNWELSAARATNILRKMSEYGIDYRKYQMSAIGYGDTQPIEKDKIISETNRRIEIKILPTFKEIDFVREKF